MPCSLAVSDAQARTTLDAQPRHWRPARSSPSINLSSSFIKINRWQTTALSVTLEMIPRPASRAKPPSRRRRGKMLKTAVLSNSTYLWYNVNDNRKKSVAKISARPTIPATCLFLCPSITRHSFWKLCFNLIDLIRYIYLFCSIQFSKKKKYLLICFVCFFQLTASVWIEWMANRPALNKLVRNVDLSRWRHTRPNRNVTRPCKTTLTTW